MEDDPLLDDIDQTIAIADVLLEDRRRINNHVDCDPAAVKRQYRRLALLANPDRTSVFGADNAYRLVSNAYAVLSDPAKKSIYDAEMHVANSTAGTIATADAISSLKPFYPSSSPVTTGDSRGTACPSCCHVHEVSREYVNRALRCPNCRRAFQAAELSALPPVVPGTDMYYCSWGFFPLGYLGEPNLFASGAPDVKKPVTTSKKTVVKKKVGCPRNSSASAQLWGNAYNCTGGVVIVKNEEAKIGSESEVHKVDDYFISFRDVNAAEDILDNL
ncbi:hypothetical protein Cni_G10213 [Canna indica]|uniref:J domain-containing protein n=1 Tax=Canna indica TaxID=4628 RepID=A0AAQ3K401_9LILI|nr:hypothetical protein Cni_G10213 [Canna indica]